jgi:hypothetical protein
MVAAREQQCGASVPEIVKPYIRQFGSFQERLERGPGYVVRVQRSPAVGTEDEFVILPQITRLETLGVLSRLVCLERLDSVPREVNQAALTIFRRGEFGAALGSGLGTPDAQGGSRKSASVLLSPSKTRPFLRLPIASVSLSARS